MACPVTTSESLVHMESVTCFTVNSVEDSYWSDAVSACEQEGGRLAVLDTKGKIDTVMDTLIDYGKSVTFFFLHFTERYR